MNREKKNTLICLLSGMIIFFLIAFSSIRNYDRTVEDISVAIEQQDGAFFTDQMEIMDLMTLNESDCVLGSGLQDLNPRYLEERIEKNPFVEDAQVFRDLKGKVEVNVKQSKPIARLFIDGKKDRYIDINGNVLPINAKHTARVPLMETEAAFGWTSNLNESRYGVEVFKLLRFIEADPFWRAQVAHIIVKKDGDIELLPQVTKQRIVFGYPSDLEKKFKKLMIFYKKVLPAKGWNDYDVVNIKFENQIICE